MVEYALSRSLNPAMIADYQLKLPNKEVLQKKWQELIELNENLQGKCSATFFNGACVFKLINFLMRL